MLSQEDIAGRPALVINRAGTLPLALICEHASHYIPRGFNNLGLRKEAKKSHAAWDIGAFAISQLLSEKLNAPLVASGVSRLVYDCNRPPDASDAMPSATELVDIPGNHFLSKRERQERLQSYYEPFRLAVSKLMAKGMKALVTVHSFTPIFHREYRTVELGVLYDTDTRLADAMMEHAFTETNLETRRNEPYGPDHGVMHTIRDHGIENGVPNVMLEIRNDLLVPASKHEEIAQNLARLIAVSLRDLDFDLPEED